MYIHRQLHTKLMSNQYNAYGHLAALYIYTAVKYVTLPFNGMTSNENNGGLEFSLVLGDLLSWERNGLSKTMPPLEGFAFLLWVDLTGKIKNLIEIFFIHKNIP